MKYWYTLHTKPRAEYRVASTLRQREIETYLPEISSPRQQQKREPFFPCYLFMHADLQSVPSWQWQWIPGLRGMVTFDDKPLPLPERVIQLIRHRLAGLETAARLPTHPFKPGDTVRIKSGPLHDMLAVFEGPTSRSQRVQVFLTFLGRISRVSVDVAELEKAPAHLVAPAAPKRPRRTRGRGRRVRY